MRLKENVFQIKKAPVQAEETEALKKEVEEELKVPQKAESKHIDKKDLKGKKTTITVEK